MLKLNNKSTFIDQKLYLRKLSHGLFYFFCLSLLLITSALAEEAETKSNPSPATPEKPAIEKPIEQSIQHTNDLEHYVESEQLKPLLAGPDKYLTLIKKNTNANTKGVAILLPEWQQGATNPKAINFLRNSLPSQGWTTIAIQPNNKPENYPSTALGKDEKQKENQTTLTEYKQKLSSLINSMMNTAKEYPGIVLMIAEGNNAALLVDIYDEENGELPNALILLSSYRQNSNEFINKDNETFALQLASTEFPVLDLYLKNDNSLVSAKAIERNNVAKQEMKVYYRQRQLNNTITGYYPEKELLSQINSWLKAVGW